MEKTSQTAARMEQATEREAHLLNLQREQAVSRVFRESGLRLKQSPEEVLRSLDRIVMVDGEPFAGSIPLSDALKTFSDINSAAVAETLSETYDKGKSVVRSRADLVSVAEKTAFIRDHSLAVWERLPNTHQEQTNGEPQTFTEFRKLSVKDKSRLTAEKGPDWIASLQRRAQEEDRYARLVGTPRR